MPKLPSNNNITAFGSQPEQPNEGVAANLGPLAVVGIGGASFAALGFTPWGKERLWDKYLQGIKAVETGSPKAILSTFRVSEFLSPLENWSELSVSAQEMRTGGIYSDFLRTSLRSQIESVEMTRAGSVFGKIKSGDQLIGMGLQIEAGSQRGTALADYYARVAGVQLGAKDSLNDAILRSKWQTGGLPEQGISFHEWLASFEPHERRKRIILGAPIRDRIKILGKEIPLSKAVQEPFAKAEVLSKFLRARAASTAGRLNTLLTNPLEIPVLEKVLSKIPVVRSMAIKPGTNTEILGRYAKKALLATAAWKGIEYADYLRANDSPMAPVVTTVGGALTGAALFKRPGMKFSKGGLLAGAAVGLYTGLAPRFDEGILYGLSSLFTDTKVTASAISEVTGLTESLKEQEEITPGFVSGSTALAFGTIGGLTVGFGDYGHYVAKSLSERAKTKQPLSQILEGLREVRTKEFPAKFQQSLLGRITKKLPGGKYLSKIKSPAMLGFMGGLAAWQGIASGLSLLSGNVMAAIPGIGLLGTTETPEELQAVYSGEQEVAIRKGRWWEMGRSTAYEGGRIEYFRPHTMARLKSRAYQKGVYGSEEERWEHDPWLNPLKALFGSDDWKYHYEQKYQQERPAPLTGTYGEEIPFIGPLIAATFGKLIKPRKLVRPEEWALGGGEYAHRSDVRGETEPAYELGGLGPGAPVSPESPSQLLNELEYRRREAVGLVGFVEGAFTKAAIGREEILPNLQTLGTMGKETGAEYWFWKHLNVGGAALTSEAVRRFIPHTRNYLDTYNPLQNRLASWLPKNDFLDSHYGNPFDKIKEAEIRLPGTGYAALHPELEGVSPEDYPLAHRVKILGDVGMWSKEYRNALTSAKRNIGQFSSEEIAMIEETERQVQEKKKRRTFQDYKFSSDMLEEQQVTVREVLGPGKFLTEEYGDMAVKVQGMGAIKHSGNALAFAQDMLEGQKVSLYASALEERRFQATAAGPQMKAVPIVKGQDFGSLMAEAGLAESEKLEDEFAQLRYSSAEQLAGKAGEYLTHGLDNPFEYLTPLSPVAKLIRHRSPIEEYIGSEAIGTSNAFWDRPFENFLEPAKNMALYQLGATDIPEVTQERRDTQEYFDMLKWVKSSRLERKARMEGDGQAAVKYQREKSRTVFGTDVFDNSVNIIRSLPRRERDFFSDFVEAKSQEDRAQILSLVPENEQRIYVSQWMKQAESAALAKKQAKIATEEDDKTISLVAQMRKSEGFAFDQGLEEQWYAETNGQIPFDEWMRERQAEEYFLTHSLPGADWLGFNPAVDLEDVKLKYVEMQGKDYHDFDLWEQRKRALARKPYINQELIEEMQANVGANPSVQVYENAVALGKIYGDKRPQVTMSKIDANFGENSYNVEVLDGRENLINKTYKYMGAA